MDWDKLAAQVHGVVNRLAPLAHPALEVAETILPEIAPAVAIGTKIIQGVIAGEPIAVELYRQITNGTQPTADQLKEFDEQYDEAYTQLDADIKAKLSD